MIVSHEAQKSFICKLTHFDTTSRALSYITSQYHFSLNSRMSFFLLGQFLFIIVRIGYHNPLEETQLPWLVLYPELSRVTHTHLSGSVIFKLMTTTTPMTQMDSDGSEPMFESGAMHNA